MENYEQERKGNFHFSDEELKDKTLMQAVSEKCLEIVMHDLKESGIEIQQ